MNLQCNCVEYSGRDRRPDLFAVRDLPRHDERLQLFAFAADRHAGKPLELFTRKKAVSRDKAQKAQKKESFALTETFTEWVTTVSTPSFSFCAFCAFSCPSTAVFRLIRSRKRHWNSACRSHGLSLC